MRRDGQLAAAREVLNAWDVAVRSVEPVSESENIVFRVRDVDGRSYVLRLHRPWYHTHEELLSEHIWTDALREHGADVPVPVLTREGQGYAVVRLGHEQRFAGLLEWVDGVPMTSLLESGAGDDLAVTRFAALGRIIATFHNQAASWSPPGGFVRHALDEDGLLGEAPFWGRFWESPLMKPSQASALDQLRRRIHALLRDYGKGHGTYTMIHADLHPANVVVDGERMHVIDFDDAGFGWHPYDLAVALFRYQDDEQFPGLRPALIEGYREVRPLASEAVDLLDLFLFVRALATIGWISARPELARQDYGPWLVNYVLRNRGRIEAEYL